VVIENVIKQAGVRDSLPNATLTRRGELVGGWDWGIEERGS
jgi:hypothetical protein